MSCALLAPLASDSSRLVRAYRLYGAMRLLSRKYPPTRPGVEAGDPGPFHHLEQLRLGAGIGKCRAAELAQQLQVVLPGAAHRADDAGRVRGEHRHEAAQAALYGQYVHQVSLGEPGLRPGQHDVVDLHRQDGAQLLHPLAGQRRAQRAVGLVHRPRRLRGPRRSAAGAAGAGGWPETRRSPVARPAAATTADDAATTVVLLVHLMTPPARRAGIDARSAHCVLAPASPK